jgi:hypothetical protein
MARVKEQPMTEEELTAAEERMKDRKSPIREADFAEPSHKVLKTEDGRTIKQFGNFQQAPKVGHQSTLKAFARIEHDYDGWIDMTPEESLKFQEQGLLIGYDQDKQLGLIKTKKRGKNEKANISASIDID